MIINNFIWLSTILDLILNDIYTATLAAQLMLFVFVVPVVNYIAQNPMELCEKEKERVCCCSITVYVIENIANNRGILELSQSTYLRRIMVVLCECAVVCIRLVHMLQPQSVNEIAEIIATL